MREGERGLEKIRGVEMRRWRWELLCSTKLLCASATQKYPYLLSQCCSACKFASARTPQTSPNLPQSHLLVAVLYLRRSSKSALNRSDLVMEGVRRNTNSQAP